MIEGSITGVESMDRAIERMRQAGSPDLMPLAETLKSILIRSNAEGLKAGLDADGNPMAELADSTVKRGRGGFGPPTVPRFDGSQLIDRFDVEAQPNDTGGFRLRAGWKGVPQVRFFKTGTKHMPKRNPAGIRPEAREQIRRAVNDFARRLSVRF